MVDSFDKVSKSYEEASKSVGLWKSEKDLILQYTDNFNDKILDMGCGVGRVSYGLEELGYTNLDAIDFSPQMIKKAKNLKNTKINFEIGDCTEIDRDDSEYDFAIFSFNGLMQIPKRENRLRALLELKRVLKDDKYLVFTSHDRNNGNQKYIDLWNQEQVEWDYGINDPRLHDFGDVITFDDVDEVEYFIHIPTFEEVKALIHEAGLTLVDSFIRSKRYRESKEVYEFSDNCRFWIVKK